jgi:hypothetical protein
MNKGVTMKKRFTILALCLAMPLLGACSTSPICATSSITPMQNKTISENLGTVSGEDSTYSVLGLFMISRPDIDRAIEKAVSLKNGDTLINVRCYTTSSYFLIFSKTTVRVEGEAVRIADISREPVRETQKGKTK